MSILGIHHLGLAVKDLKETTAFFTQYLEFTIAKEVPSYPAIFVSNGNCFITLWQTTDSPEEFNRKSNIGLHHFALKIESKTALDELHNKVKKHTGVKVEFAPEKLGDGPSEHCIIYEPGGIRIEFIWTPEAKRS